MKKSISLAFTFSLLALVAFSQDENKNIYSGGMLILQPGYTIAENNHQKINDIGFGLGGILRFYFYGYFTTGIYGGTQRTNYSTTNSESSYITLGYGGPFLGFSKNAGRFRYTVSAFVGRGSIKNLHVEDQDGNVLADAYFYRKSTAVYSPIVSLDYALSQRLLLTFQTVYLVAKVDENRVFKNPTFQVGILFNR